MPWHIARGHGCPPSEPWAVVKDSSGEVEGCHASKAKAQRQIAALHASEAGVSPFLKLVVEANSEESLVAPFLTVIRATRDAAGSGDLANVVDVWVDAVQEHITPALTEVAAIMVVVAARSNGLDEHSMPQSAIDDLVADFVVGVEHYADLLGALAYRRLSKDPSLTLSEVLASALTDERADLLADGLATHLRNGLTATVLTIAAPGALVASAATNPFDRTKMWVSMRDNRVRAAHADADSQIVGVSESFMVGGHPARFAGDPQLPPELRINCRCVTVSADGVDPADASEISELVSGLIASRREKLAAIRSERLLDRAAAAANADAALIEGGSVAGGTAPSADSTGLLVSQLIGETVDVSTVDLDVLSDELSTLGLPASLIFALIAAIMERRRELAEENDEVDEFTVDTWKPRLDGFAAVVERCGCDRPVPPRLAVEALLRAGGTMLHGFVTAGPDYTDGVMVNLRPVPEQADALALPGGLPPEDLHLTLAYLGSVEDHDPAHQEMFVESLGEVASETTPLQGVVTAVTVFNMKADDKAALVALIDVPGMTDLRVEAVEAVDEVDDDAVRTEHDFIPHITLGYGPTPSDIEAAQERVGMSVNFDALELTWGADVTVITFDGSDMEDDAMPPTATINEADLVTINDTGLVGVVAETSTDAALTDTQGNSLVGSPDVPTVLVDVVESGTFTSTGVTIVTNMNLLSTFMPMLDDEVRGRASNPRTNAERAAAGDFDWEGVLIVEGMDSGDGRRIAMGALTWRDLPVTLMGSFQNPESGGHALAVPSGSIWEIHRKEYADHNDIIGRGFFDSGDDGMKLRRMIEEGTVLGVSADLDSVKADLVESGDGEAPKIEVTSGRIMGATGCAFPAFMQAYVEILTEEEVLVASGALVRIHTPVVEGQFALFTAEAEEEVSTLVASGKRRNVAPVEPPGAWFAKQELDGPMAMVVTAEGRIFGHSADFRSCHIGLLGRCTQAPKTGCAYKFFRTGAVLTAEGDLIATGPIYIDGGHAPTNLGYEAAKDWMSDTLSAVADVAVYEDEWGIQIAGALRPDATPEQVRVLRGSDISPDWRPIDGRREMVGLVCVNTSGFVVPSTLVASGAPQPVAADGSMHVTWDFETDEPEVMIGVGMLRHEIDPNDELATRLAAVEEFLLPLRAERALAKFQGKN